jgi:hypothetical protein
MVKNDWASRKRFRAGDGLILALFFGLALTARQGPPWKGTISNEDGTVIVRNPKKPVLAEGAFSFAEDLSIGNHGGQPEPLFSRLWYLAVDDEGNIYAMDQGDSQVKVFDHKGAFLRAIGRKGEGPGEFLHPNNIFMTQQRELVVEDYIRNLTYFGADGKYLRTVSTVRLFPIGISLDSAGRIIALRNFSDPERSGREIDVYDPNLIFLRTLAVFPQPKPDPALLEPFLPDVRWGLSDLETLIVASGETYEIDLFDFTGRLAKKIVRDYDRIKITDEDVKYRVRKVPEGRKLVVPKFFPAIRSLMADEEGRILAGTYEKRAEGAFVYDVFDPAGKYIAKVALKGRPQVWKKNTLYVIDETEDGFQYIKRFRECGQI